MKTNTKKIGITVKVSDGDKPIIAPTVYPDNYADFNFDEKVDAMARAVNEGIKHRPELPELTAEEARRHITLTVMNAEKNAERLETTPHFLFADGELAAVPRWRISENASFIVSNDLAAHMGLTPDEVLQIGQQNINSQHFEAESMRETLMKMMGQDIPPEIMMEMLPPMSGPEMIVMSNEQKMQGASVLLSQQTLDELHEKNGDYVIIPSSIHEVIAVPITDDISPDELRAMVKEVNGTQVAPEEQLSDNIMMYDGQKLSLVGDTFKLEMEQQTMKQESVKFAM